MRLWLPILLCACFGVAGNLSLKYGMQGYRPDGSQPVVAQLILRILTRPALLGGLALYGISMLGWLRLLSTEKLSFVYPLFVSLSFLLVMTCSALLFREEIRWPQMVGCTVIVLGIWIATR